MRTLSDAEILVVAGGFDMTEDPLHPKSFGDKKKDNETHCPSGYHPESGTATGGGGKVGGNVSVYAPIEGIPIGVKANSDGQANVQPASWSGCTANGYHHDPSGHVVRDK